MKELQIFTMLGAIEGATVNYIGEVNVKDLIYFTYCKEEIMSGLHLLCVIDENKIHIVGSISKIDNIYYYVNLRSISDSLSLVTPNLYNGVKKSEAFLDYGLYNCADTILDILNNQQNLKEIKALNKINEEYIASCTIFKGYEMRVSFDFYVLEENTAFKIQFDNYIKHRMKSNTRTTVMMMSTLKALYPMIFKEEICCD